MKSYKITVQGKVQGVYYRKTIQQNAQKLGLKGYIKNLANGEVEVGINLEKIMYETFINILKNGSRNSNVKRLNIHKTTEIYESFSIEY